MTKWIDLNDNSGAKLKLATLSVEGQPTLHLFVTNIAYTNPKFAQVHRELGFNIPPSRRYLVRRVEPNEKIAPSKFSAVFPGARFVEMERGDYMLNTGSAATKQTNEEQATDIDMRGVKRLGRNEQGAEVFDSLSGRFFRNDAGVRIIEAEGKEPYLFLRLHAPERPSPVGRDLNEALTRVALGFVRAMDMGEVQRSEDYDAFSKAVFPEDAPAEVDELLSAAIDGALLRYVRQTNDVALEAYNPMARLYDYLPPYRGTRRGEGALPPPLSIAAQRLLGDTTDKTVIFPNAFDGASFAFLPSGTRIRAYRGQEGVVDLSDFATSQEGVTGLGRYAPTAEAGANALFFNADPVLDAQGNRRDYVDALASMRSLAPGARAIIALAADDPAAAGRVGQDSARFLTALGSRFSVEDVFETAPILTRKSGGERGLRIYSLRNSEPLDRSAQMQKLGEYETNGLPVMSSWDQVKSHVDEIIHRIDLKEAESEALDLERIAANESYQRPYVAFSKVGEARTMVPANLQASAQAYMTRLEGMYGPVDEFVGQQLGMGINTLSANFSPEQVDGVAVMISRALIGRSSLLADDTGLGKGRQLAAMATWANKRGENMIFVTDRANLFSDLARDLKNIGEWDRFRPLVMNSDGEITFEESPGAEPVVLAKGTPAAKMAEILEHNTSMEELQVNAVFLTYSQIANEESPKAVWLKNQLSNSMVIFDEAHVAAGSDSNIAVQVAEIAALAKHAQFASATWAKSHDNMHIYQRAFPASVSVSTLSETMRKGGDSFSEIFSTMLSAEGALVRREHDLSKLEVEMVIDEENRARNEEVSDKVADVLGAASFVSGEMQQVFIRANSESVARLRGARDVRATSVRAKLFSASFGAGSVIYQVMKAVQGTLNATHVAKLAIESVRQGMKPVIVSDATGESLLEALIDDLVSKSEDGKRPDHVKIPTIRDMLRHVLYKRLATVRVEDVSAADIAADDEANRRDAGGRHGSTADGIDVPEAEDAEEMEAAVGAAQVPTAEATTVIVDAPLDSGDEALEEAVDVHAAFNAAPLAEGEQSQPDASAAEFDEGESGSKRAKRRKRVYRDVLVTDLPDMPEEAKERYAIGLAEIEEKISAVPDLPVSAFDVIAQSLRDAGISVGELTGRKNSLVRDPGMQDASMWRLVPRAKSKKALKATIRSFNNGTTTALIINRAVAAGVSLHASPKFLDHSRRHLIEHQIPEDPITRVQLLGRVNRYDQLSTPLIYTASTGIFGEVRYLMMQNRKLARMSANVRSSRDNAMSLKGVTDLFNIVGRQAVQGYLQDNALVMKRLGIEESEIEMNYDIVNKLTMRLPLLKVTQQKQVYEELYSRVDEILLRAELDGQNPLRPNEMDIGAKTASEIVFFGDDSPPDEHTSAFDAPVIARRIEWEQDRNPMSYTAVREVAKVNVERLVSAGYLLACEADAQPVINPDFIKKVVDGFHGMTRLAHMATDAPSYEEAMVNNGPAKRAYLRYCWMKANLPNLIPGARVGKNLAPTDTENANDGITNVFHETIVIDVRPPENQNDLLDPGKWRLTVITASDDRPQTYSLRSVLTNMSGKVSVGEITRDLSADLWGPSFRVGLFTGPQSMLRNQFDMVMRGKRRYDATALTGNMYLAAEWAAATKQGTSAIYTDEAGSRHRVIMLDKDAGRFDPQYLPVRVADPDQLVKFLMPLAAPGEGEAEPELSILDTTFKSALAAVDNSQGRFATGPKRDAIMAIAPGSTLALSCSPKDVRRLRTALFAGQVSMRTAALGPRTRATDDPAHVIIRSHTTKKDIGKLPVKVQAAMRLTSGLAATQNVFSVGGGSSGEVKEAKVSVLSLQIHTPEQAARAIELIRRFSGLEVYASTNDLKQRARLAISEVLAARRTELRNLQEELRQSVNVAAGREPAVVPLADQSDTEPEAFSDDNTSTGDADRAETGDSLERMA